MKAFDLQVTGSLVVTGSIKTTDGTFILSGSDSNASSSFSSRITTNESNMTLATASIAAITSSISRLNTESSLATASIAAITSSISRLNTESSLATASIAAITASVAEMKEFTNADTISGSFTSVSSSIASRFDSRETDMALATASIAAITASLGQPVNTDSNVTFNNINSTGTITAVEVHTTFVSSSIAVSSGSNNFGDESSDHHSFTGSVSISGSSSDTSLISYGKVGIGTVNPVRPLGISYGKAKTDTNVGYAMSIQSNESSGQAALQFYAVGGASAAARKFQLQTTEVGVANAGIIEFQPDGGVVSFANNVGIGTTSPSDNLHIQDSVPGLRLVDTGNSATAQIGYSDGSGFFLRLPDDANNEDVMIRSYGDTIFNGGNVGIGTTSPLADLHVSGSNGKILMSDHGQVTLEMQTNDTAAIFQRDLGSTATSGISSAIFMQGKDTANEMLFHVNYGGGDSGNNYNNRLRLTQTSASFDNCNVGIGTRIPLEKLHVDDGDILVSSARGVRANGGNEMIRFDNSDGVKINSGGKHMLSFKRDNSILHHSGGTNAGMELYKQTSGASANLLFTVVLQNASSLYHLTVCEIIIAHIGNAAPRAISHYIWEIENHNSFASDRPSIQTPVLSAGDAQSLTVDNPSADTATFQINGQGGSTTNIGAYFRVVSGVTGVASLT